MTDNQIVLLIASGIIVGIINTLAGGGSVISLAVFMLLGLPPQIANGTNRVAVLFQSMASAGLFRHYRVLELRSVSWLAIPTVAGSVVGAQLAVDINEQTFRSIIAVLLLCILAILIVNPDRWISEHKSHGKSRPGWIQIVVFFGIGVYGGFIQAGVGYFLLAAIVLGAGYDLVKANAIKVWIVFLYTPFALSVFLINGQVHWMFGLVHAVGNIIGALIATRMAVKRGAKFIRWAVIVLIIFTAADITGLFDVKAWIAKLL